MSHLENASFSASEFGRGDLPPACSNFLRLPERNIEEERGTTENSKFKCLKAQLLSSGSVCIGGRCVIIQSGANFPAPPPPLEGISHNSRSSQIRREGANKRFIKQMNRADSQIWENC